MRTLVSLTCLSLLPFFSQQLLHGQEEGNTPVPEKKKNKISSTPRMQDQILLDLHGSQILRQQGAGVSPKWYSYGITFALFYDAPVRKTPLSFAIGAGVSNENFFLNREIVRTANGEGSDFVAPAAAMRRYKFSTTTLEVPLEFRIRFKPERRNTVKINLGFAVGYLVQSKTKRVGEGEQYGQFTSKAKVKEYNVAGIDNLRLTPYLRVGWSRFNITARYQANPLFKSGRGPQGWHPISIGFSLTPF
ncbi:MAG: PorT family protein [Flavobacteriales bacterium]|nr:PorT family protein [Flavobacteriales bacterium]MDW8431929.1 outer membrane beta-barrel protein [Flavobacteriales bacterium]